MSTTINTAYNTWRQFAPQEKPLTPITGPRLNVQAGPSSDGGLNAAFSGLKAAAVQAGAQYAHGEKRKGLESEAKAETWMKSVSPDEFRKAAQEGSLPFQDDPIAMARLRYLHGFHASAAVQSQVAENKLKHMNVDPALFQKVLGHVKKSSKLGSKGQLNFNAGRFLRGSGKDVLDARQVVAEIRRMGDMAASDVIQRPSIGDTFIWADSGKASLIGFLTQFQTFSMRSLEKKFMKGANRIRNGDVDEALQLTLSMGLSGIGVAAFAAIRGQTIMDEGKRQEFYKNALGYDSENDAWDLSTLAVGALKRSSYMAAPAMAYDTIGSPLGLPYAGLGRTTVSAP